jgi:hypothetical protein
MFIEFLLRTEGTADCTIVHSEKISIGEINLPVGNLKDPFVDLIRKEDSAREKPCRAFQAIRNPQHIAWLKWQISLIGEKL